MKYCLTCIILGISISNIIAQGTSIHKEGDTLYYHKNKLTALKTDTFIIIKNSKELANNNYNVEKFSLDTLVHKFILNAKFTTNGLQQLRTNGIYKAYHSNGAIAAIGATVSGKVGDGIWTYYYKNGKKKSEEQLSKSTFFNDNKTNLVVSFWDIDGNLTVKEGTGFAAFTSKKNNYLDEGFYKDGLKNGVWSSNNGSKKNYQENYKKGKLVKGTSWNSIGESFSYKELNTRPYFRKRVSNTVKKYIENKLGNSAKDIRGTIAVRFVVTKEGLLKNIVIVKGVQDNYNTEIIKILSEISVWTPAKERGQNLDANFLLQLNFN